MYTFIIKIKGAIGFDNKSEQTLIPATWNKDRSKNVI